MCVLCLLFHDIDVGLVSIEYPSDLESWTVAFEWNQIVDLLASRNSLDESTVMSGFSLKLCGTS